MRFYDIIILETDGQTLFRRYTSFVDGVSVRGALNIELDLPIATVDIPSNGAMCKVWGIPLEDITQASNFNGKLIKIYGGMRYGLPLARPEQSALLVQGSIFQCFGNWQGEEMSNTFIIQPSLGSEKMPKNVTLEWRAGTRLDDALANAILGAMPVGAVIDFGLGLDPRLVAPADIIHVAPSINELARVVLELSKSIITDASYRGVTIAVSGDSFSITDKGIASESAIYATDLIGQPTFLDAVTVQIKAVMRGDIALHKIITMPDGFLGISNKGSASFIRNNIQFTGKFQIVKIRHIGNFRQPDANSWVTVLDLFAQNG